MPSASRRWPARTFGSAPTCTDVLGSQKSAVITPRGRWYFIDREMTRWSLASRALTIVSPANPSIARPFQVNRRGR